MVPQKPQSAIAEAQPSTPVLAKDYRIGVDDLVQISVWDNPELSVTVPVRPDSKISGSLIFAVKESISVLSHMKNRIKRQVVEGF